MNPAYHVQCATEEPRPANIEQEVGERVPRYTVILVPAGGGVSAAVPAMPGCYSHGRTRDEALTRVREAMAGWIEVEAKQGCGPLPETPSLIVDGLAQSLHVIDSMRAAGELPPDSGYGLELATVDLPQLVAA